MKWFAIMGGGMFLQYVAPNKNYIRTGRAIQTDLHSYNEFNPYFPMVRNGLTLPPYRG